MKYPGVTISILSLRTSRNLLLMSLWYLNIGKKFEAHIYSTLVLLKEYPLNEYSSIIVSITLVGEFGNMSQS